MKDEMKDIAERSDVVIIGGVACGPKTAATLARRLPDLKITLFQREKELSYGSCGLPYFASGDISSFQELTTTSYDIPRTPDFFEKTKGFAAITEAEVVAVDPDNKKITVRMLADGSEIEHHYDQLVLATGASPRKAPFPVADSEKIRSFTRPADAIHFRKMAETGKVGSAVIVGAGFIGCELAEATASLWGIETTLIEREPQVLPYVLDAEMSTHVEAELKKQDVTVLKGSEVQKIELSDDGQPTVHIDGATPIVADYVFLCLGVLPNVELAANCGMTLGATGAIEVDERLRTNIDDIYAGGDCSESTHRLTGGKLFLPMGSLANRHGRVIAENIAENETEFAGVLGAFLVKVFDMNVGSVGLSEAAAQSAGLNPACVWGTFPDRAEYYPEAGTFTMKMVYDRESLRLLGLQVVGNGTIGRRIDVFSVFLQNNAVVDDLLDFEHGYAPPYSEALDPLHQLAAVAIAQQKGTRMACPYWRSLMDLSSNAIWLDVRENEETESVPWQPEQGDVVHIPLNDLRGRLEDLDRKRKTLVLCRRGLRAYQAALILEAAGFEDVIIASGGTSAIVRSRATK